MAGDTLTASDFHLYAFFTHLTLNNVKKHQNLSDALLAALKDFPKLNAYLDKMGENLKDYMANRPNCWL